MNDGKTAFLIIDLQRAFFQDSELAVHRERVVSATNVLSAAARQAGIPVFLITTEHSRDRSTWTLNMLDDDQGFLFHGDETTEVLEELHTEQMTRIEKTRDSAWLGTDLHMRLRNLEIQHIVIAGVSTHGCIAQTVRDGYAHNIRTVLVSDAVADARDDFHEATIRQLVADRMVDLKNSEQLRQAWLEAAS